VPPVVGGTSFEADCDHKDLWTSYAYSYDEVLPYLDFYQQVVERHIAALSADDVETVIDIGAGTGSVAVPLITSGRAVTCVDNNRAMLERLRMKLEGRTTDRIEIVQQNAEELSAWADGAFDGVNILLALFDMANPQAAFGHALRVLRPGGILVLTEPKRSFDLDDLLAHAEQWLRNQGLHGRLKPHWERVCEVNAKIRPGQRRSWMPIEEILKVINESGFRVESVRDSHHGNCATVVARKLASKALTKG